MLATRTPFHIIDPDGRRRAKLSRFVISLDGHAEIYENYEEFIHAQPIEGILLAAYPDAQKILDWISDNQYPFSVTVYSDRPDTRDVVTAMKSGAFDFLEWPISDACLSRSLGAVAEAHGATVCHFRKRSEARKLMQSLTPREREVLVGIVAGKSSKQVGMTLGISPRTIEVHRGKLMSKLEARSAVDVVRVAVSAGIELSP